MADGLYRQVRSLNGLRRAWGVVRTNGLASQSRETSEDVRRFDERAEVRLRRIADQLREHRFNFAPAKGVPVPRPGKAPRPIIIAPIENRVVQRRILDILKQQESLLPYLMTPTSFGGVPGRDVQTALRVAVQAIRNGRRYYVRSDVSNFFSFIPKATVLEILNSHLVDGDFKSLLRDAVEVELSNLEELGRLAELFPLHEIGVAQGCCLSVLLGNVLLREFDERLNGRGIVCLRYIDDFLLIGPTRAHVLKAFESACRLLSTHGLTAYDPRRNTEKAACGAVDDGFEFLGCEVLRGWVRPSRSAQKRLLASMDQVLSVSLARLQDAHRRGFDRRYSYNATLYYVSNLLRGWGNQYSFCNDQQVLENLDREVRTRWRNYERRYRLLQAGFDEMGSLRALGLHLLPESKRDPIRWDEVDEEALCEAGMNDQADGEGVDWALG